MYRSIGQTDVGKVRTQNQDVFAAQRIENLGLVAVVCDGMGGAKAGNIAAEKAQEVLLEVIRLGAQRVGAQYTVQDLLTDAVLCANETIYEMSSQDEALRGMGTTAVVAVVDEGVAKIVHVGDSRAYLIDSEAIRQITTDHTIVQLLVEHGQLTQQEARVHPKRNLITRAIGADAAIEVDYDETPLPTGAVLLLCSDGLSSYVEENRIADVARMAPADAPQRLIDLANANGGSDNITVLVVFEAESGSEA